MRWSDGWLVGSDTVLGSCGKGHGEHI